MTTIIAKLSKGHWVATENDVETLAHERYANAVMVAGADSTYLRVVLVASQAKLGKARGRTAPRVNTDSQLAVLKEVHDRFYAAVLRGVTTPDIAIEPDLDAKEQRARSLERNSRSAFARSATSTLTAYVKAGGDLRSLDAAAVTKAALRAAMAPPEPADRIARQIHRARKSLLRAFARRAQDNPEEAGTEIESLMDELQKILDALNGNEEEEAAPDETTTTVGSRPRDVGVARTRVGIPQLHRGA